MPFEFEPLDIPDIILVHAQKFPDDRGFFIETYKQDDFASNGIAQTFIQDNYSRSTRNVLRGLHYQKDPSAQGKLIQVLQGEIYDVAIDIRKGSPTYKQWIGVHLSAERSQLLYVPEGFAHGFCVLSDVVDFTYKCTNLYAPNTYRGVLWNDPDLNIPWPIKDPILSERDQNLPQLKDADNNYTY